MEYTPAELIAANGKSYEHFFGTATEEDLLRVARDDEVDDLQCFLAESKVLPVVVIRALCAAKSERVTPILAENCQTLPEDVEARFALGRLAEREGLAYNQAISAKSQEVLLQEKDPFSLQLLEQILAQNFAATPETQEHLFKVAEKFQYGRILVRLAKNKSLITNLQGPLSMNACSRRFVWEALSNNSTLDVGPHLGVPFLKVYHPKVVEPGQNADQETFYSVAQSWEGTLEALREACQLVSR